jgi:hypothetical protein
MASFRTTGYDFRHAADMVPCICPELASRACNVRPFTGSPGSGVILVLASYSLKLQYCMNECLDAIWTMSDAGVASSCLHYPSDHVCLLAYQPEARSVDCKGEVRANKAAPANSTQPPSQPPLLSKIPGLSLRNDGVAI